ncbi:MAG: phosphoribosyltransferase [Archaeoglobaceae archaeon]|nr:phosphoribosyltransferase [Archaeoglobaceae archaeon]MCX8152175.1 phosphoribosyltransferase [Archaeoglobaceae archaeon]MDW8013891.1 phosphoribosyltransferase [Archaeoglobaceae archaeon]
MKCLQYSWEEILKFCEELANKIKKSGYRPDVIVAIARGGWIPARILCDHLNIKELYSIKTEHWGIVATKTGEARITQPLNVKLENKKVLVVDDVADTGETVKLVLDHVKSFSPEDVKIAVIDYKRTSGFVPDYYVNFIEEWKWVVYPWSLREDVKDLLKDKKFNLKEAMEYLKSLDLKVSEEIVRDVLSDM